jgi:hypothetical protein
MSSASSLGNELRPGYRRPRNDGGATADRVEIMRHASGSLPFALVLAAAVQAPGAVLPDLSNTNRPLQPGLLSPLLEGAGSVSAAADQAARDQPRVAQRFLNFQNCPTGRRC